MADTRRTLSALATLLADNTSGAISPQDLRDFMQSTAPPFGGLYMTTPAETTIGTQDVFVKAAGTTTSRTLSEFTSPSANRLTYTGTPDVHATAIAVVSFVCASSDQVIAFRIAENGDATTADPLASQSRFTIGTAGVTGLAVVHFDGVLSTNDYLELWIANGTSTGNATVNDLKMFAQGILA